MTGAERAALEKKILKELTFDGSGADYVFARILAPVIADLTVRIAELEKAQEKRERCGQI